MSDAMDVDKTHSQVSQYYGKELTQTKDLKTNACCTATAPPKYIRECIGKIHDDVVAKYYGCGLCLPQYDLSGCKILDLGCGAGRDVYIASQLVGKSGKVVGVDMTQEQLETARATKSYHAEKFGFDNVEFYKGYLEKLDEIPELQEGTFDVIISNCVINLCADKEAVLKHCWKLLKPGGELYFSDVYSTCRVPETLRRDPVLWGECLSGALYWNDFENLVRRVGFADPRLVEDEWISITNKDVEDCIRKNGPPQLRFASATYRLWKLDNLEQSNEDFGQAVTYKGTIPRYESKWLLDKGYSFDKDKKIPVSGNTWNMLKNTILKDHFEFHGNFDQHVGIFAVGRDVMPFGGGKGAGSSCCGPKKAATTTNGESSCCGPRSKAPKAKGGSCCG